MDSTDGPAVITHGRLQELASLYEQTIPKSLQDLERIRVKEVPESLTLRKRDGNALLEKDEVKALVEWKLYAHIVPKKGALLPASERLTHISVFQETRYLSP